MKTTMQLAVDALIQALDKTPRNDWEQTALMALQSVKDLGYADGYRVGSFDLGKITTAVEPSNDTGEDVGLAQMASAGDGHAMPAAIRTDFQPTPAMTDQGPLPEVLYDESGPGVPYGASPIQGEDKALADNKPTPEEELEDLGHEILRKLAKQLALAARERNMSVENIVIVAKTVHDPEEKTAIFITLQ